MLNGLLIFAAASAAVILGVALAAVLGGAALRKLDIDAFSRTTPVQVQINTVAASLGRRIRAADYVSDRAAIGGLPGLEGMRSVSKV